MIEVISISTTNNISYIVEAQTKHLKQTLHGNYGDVWNLKTKSEGKKCFPRYT